MTYDEYLDALAPGEEPASPEEFDRDCELEAADRARAEAKDEGRSPWR